jgi:hypothetical protein
MNDKIDEIVGMGNWVWLWFRRILFVLILITLLVVSLSKCNPVPVVYGTDTYDTWKSVNDYRASVDATATFGAQEFHIQLTAISLTETPSP